MEILITMAYTAIMTFVAIKVTEKVPSERNKKKLPDKPITGAEAIATICCCRFSHR